MTHTEKVHVLFGLGLVLTGVLAFRAERRESLAAATVWPVLAFVIGLLLFIPVEGLALTYTQVGWVEVLRSIVPDSPGTWIRDWLDKSRVTHVTQHKIGGLAAMIAGLVELGLARGWLLAARWRQVLPAALLTTGLAFGIHGGTMHHLPTRTEQAHHYLLGAGLVTAGVTVTLFRAGLVRHRAWGLVWPVLTVLAGLNLMLFYRLPSGTAGPARHAPAGVTPASSEAP